MSKLGSFYADFPTVKVAKGDVLFQQTDIPTVGYVIKRGVIRICNISASGSEKIVSFKVTNEPFPVCWLFSKTTTALFFYQAHTDCELYVISKDDFSTPLHNNKGFALEVVDILANAYVNASLQVDALVQAKASLKLLYAFRHLCLRYGRDIQSNMSQIQIPLTQQELANYTGLTRETITLELNRFRSQGVIAYSRKYYSVNTKKVNNLIEDEYNPGVNPGLKTVAPLP